MIMLDIFISVYNEESLRSSNKLANFFKNETIKCCFSACYWYTCNDDLDLYDMIIVLTHVGNNSWKP